MGCLVIAGATDMDGFAISKINGEYERSRYVCNGRAVYKKVGGGKRALWMSAAGTWWMWCASVGSQFG